MSWRTGFRAAAAALAIGVLIGAPIALGQEPSGPPPKDTIFARKILMGAIDMNMDAIETMLAPNGKFDAATHFAAENGAICPGLLPFCYLMGAVGAGRAVSFPYLAFPPPNAASIICAALSSLPWIRWP